MTISLWHRYVDVALLVYRIKTVLYMYGKHIGIYLCGLDVRMGKHLANHLDASTGEQAPLRPPGCFAPGIGHQSYCALLFARIYHPLLLATWG